MSLNLKQSIESIKKSLSEAHSYFDQDIFGHSNCENPLEISAYFIDKAFIETLTVLEYLNLSNTFDRLQNLYKHYQNRKGGFTKVEVNDYGPSLVAPGEIGKYIDSIANIANVKIEKQGIQEQSIKKLIKIIRNSVYSICDSTIFSNQPKKEKDVHNRIEGILKCVYSDLISEPPLSKPVKSFRPDTGIPSLKTIIEYKFISTKQDSKKIADEILADTRGYKSKEYSNIIFVIYETERIKNEKEWNYLLKKCGASENTKVIVLSGAIQTKK